MRRNLVAVIVGVLVAIIVGFALPSQSGLWTLFLATAVGAGCTGWIARGRSWILGGLVGILYAVLLAWNAIRVFGGFNHFYGIKVSASEWAVIGAQIACLVPTASIVAEGAGRVRRSRSSR